MELGIYINNAEYKLPLTAIQIWVSNIKLHKKMLNWVKARENLATLAIVELNENQCLKYLKVDDGFVPRLYPKISLLEVSACFFQSSFNQKFIKIVCLTLVFNE